ncbi:MAG TPA: hypothetical protein VD962_04380 [Rubricoccaceae bacterium]|nr:hypothetical protein [Rubricoccaceae bacterium]
MPPAASRLGLVVFALVAAPAAAQPTTDPPADTTGTPLIHLELADGTALVGRVVREDDEQVEFRTTGGALVIVPAAQVRSRRPFEGAVRGGRAVASDPNGTRLFFAPTGRPLGRGQGYVAAYEVFFPLVAYGITERVSVSGGTVLAPGAFGSVVYAASKATFLRTNAVDLAAGVFLLTAFFESVCSDEGCEESSGVGGIAYGVGTVGDDQRAVTLGAGASVGAAEGGGLVLVGGELQVSNSIKLLSENYVAFAGGDAGTVISAGVRFFGERLAADLGLFTSPDLLLEEEVDLADFPFLPWVGFTYNFGR